MPETVEDAPRPSLARRAVAVVIVCVAAYLILKLAVHLIVGIFASILWAVVAVVVIIGLIWALRQL